MSIEFENKIKKHFLEGAALKNKVVEQHIQDIQSFGVLVAEAIKSGHKILICGNGGSAADSQHFAAELVGRLVRERNPLPALALSTDTSILTALSNDYGVDKIFERQVAALGARGDVLFVLSTSGNSANVVNAVKCAHDNGMTVFALLGKDGGTVAGMADHSIIIPSISSQLIQELHITIIHIVCELIEDIVCPI